MYGLFVIKRGLLVTVLASLLVLSCAQPSSAQTSRKPSLKERLTFGLQVRLPSEKAFINAIVTAVEQGRISQKLVDSTFFWARKRTPVKAGRYTRRPIIYFQPALEIQLNRLNIDIGTPRLSFFSRRL